MGGGVLETRGLGVLGRQVHDRIADEVGDPERAAGLRRREVADRHRDCVAARLRPQPGDHRPRQLDPVDLDAASGERQSHAPGPDSELERAPAACQRRQEVDGRVEHRRVERIGGHLVVRVGHGLSEVAVFVGHQSA